MLKSCQLQDCHSPCPSLRRTLCDAAPNDADVPMPGVLWTHPTLLALLALQLLTTPLKPYFETSFKVQVCAHNSMWSIILLMLKLYMYASGYTEQFFLWSGGISDYFYFLNYSFINVSIAYSEYHFVIIKKLSSLHFITIF